MMVGKYTILVFSDIGQIPRCVEANHPDQGAPIKT